MAHAIFIKPLSAIFFAYLHHVSQILVWGYGVMGEKICTECVALPAPLYQRYTGLWRVQEMRQIHIQMCIFFFINVKKKLRQSETFVNVSDQPKSSRKRHRRYRFLWKCSP